MYKKILAPIDLSDKATADLVLQVARHFVEREGSDIEIIYVRPFIMDAALAYLPPDFFSREEKEAEERLFKLVHESGLPETTHLVSPLGSVRDEVIKEVQRFKPNLVVIGSHRPSAFSMMLGSTAAAVVREAPCSVLIAR